MRRLLKMSKLQSQGMAPRHIVGWRHAPPLENVDYAKKGRLPTGLQDTILPHKQRSLRG